MWQMQVQLESAQQPWDSQPFPWETVHLGSDGLDLLSELKPSVQAFSMLSNLHPWQILCLQVMDAV
jgi:hypothetical protein